MPTDEKPMTIHYHGTPITPLRVLETLAGRCFCVSYAAPSQVARCHEIGQSVMLDNGAFSAWRVGRETDWPGYYRWVEKWLDHPTTWAVIPDVIGGSASENDELVSAWPFHGRGWPVWHLHEPIRRLSKLSLSYGQVCFGSSDEYAQVGSPAWKRRVDEAFDAIFDIRPRVHMLRGLSTLKMGYPFYSVDSTDIARNHHLVHDGAHNMASRWDSMQAGRWRRPGHGHPPLLETSP